MKKEIMDNGLRILRADEGHLIYKKNEEEPSYYEIVYLAKFENEYDYGEVTRDYVYGKNYDGQIEELNKTISSQQEQIDFQTVIIDSQSEMIDFLLFFDNGFELMSVNMCAVDEKEVSQMAVYLARRILLGKLSYKLVMSKFADLKEDIDFILIMEGREDLIEE